MKDNKGKLSWKTRNKIQDLTPFASMIALLAYPFILGIFIPEFIDFMNSSFKIVWSKNLIIAFVLLIPWLCGWVWFVYKFRGGNCKKDIFTSSLMVLAVLGVMIILFFIGSNNKKEYPTSEDMFELYTKDDFLIEYNLDNANENVQNEAWYYFSEGMVEGKIATETLYEDRENR